MKISQVLVLCSISVIVLFSAFILWKRYSKDPNEALADAIGKGDIVKIKKLINRGADVNADIPGPQNIMTHAFWYPYPNRKWYSNKPILRLSQEEREAKIYQILELLIANSADVNTIDELGTAPIHCAISNYYIITELLIEKGADVNIKNSNGNTPLHSVAVSNSIETAELLINNGADVNATNNEGKTPLYRAVEVNKLEMVEFLIANGANVNIKSHGVSPLQVAETRNNNKEIADLLRKHGGIK